MLSGTVVSVWGENINDGLLLDLYRASSICFCSSKKRYPHWPGDDDVIKNGEGETFGPRAPFNDPPGYSKTFFDPLFMPGENSGDWWRNTQFILNTWTTQRPAIYLQAADDAGLRNP